MPPIQTLIASLLLVSFSWTAQAQQLYVKTYGNQTDPSVVFVHGGPRGNATLFEATTAQVLADAGFYVVVYDRRGEGRSIDTGAKFTFDEAIEDLNNLANQLSLRKFSIIGHSFGGIVSTLYTQAFPERVERLILVGALVDQQRTYDHILSSVAKQAEEKHDMATLEKIKEVKTLDKKSAVYRGKTYELASAYGYFRMPAPTEESEIVNNRYTKSEFFKDNIRNDQAPVTFYKNEKRVTMDTTPILNSLKKRGRKLYALYGKQDGIFSKAQLQDVQKLIGKHNFYLIDNCSHYPFVDQNITFVNIITKVMGNEKE